MTDGSRKIVKLVGGPWDGRIIRVPSYAKNFILVQNPSGELFPHSRKVDQDRYEYGYHMFLYQRKDRRKRRKEVWKLLLHAQPIPGWPHNN